MKRSFISATGLLSGLLTLMPIAAEAQTDPVPPPIAEEAEDVADEAAGQAATAAEAVPQEVPPVSAMAGSDAAASFTFGAPTENLVFASTGYSGVLRGGYWMPLGGFPIGLELILDVGLFNGTGSGIPGSVTLGVGAPMKFILMNTDMFIWNVTATPGLGVSFVDGIEVNEQTVDGFEIPLLEETTLSLFALMLHASSNFGYKLNEDFIIGGGLDIPMTFLFGSAFVFVFPILIGPTAEYQITDAIAVSAAVKFGPHISTGDTASSGYTVGEGFDEIDDTSAAIDSTSFGFKFFIGATYTF